MTWVSLLWPHSVGSILHSALWGQGDSKPAWLPTAAVRVQIGPLHCCTWTAWLNVFKKGNPKEFRLGQCPKVWLFLSDTVLLRTSPLINFYVDSTRRRVKDPFVNQLAARLYFTTGCYLVWSLATCFALEVMGVSHWLSPSWPTWLISKAYILPLKIRWINKLFTNIILYIDFNRS